MLDAATTNDALRLVLSVMFKTLGCASVLQAPAERVRGALFKMNGTLGGDVKVQRHASPLHTAPAGAAGIGGEVLIL